VQTAASQLKIGNPRLRHSGVNRNPGISILKHWTPAFAGVTRFRRGDGAFAGATGGRGADNRVAIENRESAPTSFRCKPESRISILKHWTPAFAGVTRFRRNDGAFAGVTRFRQGDGAFAGATGLSPG